MPTQPQVRVDNPDRDRPKGARPKPRRSVAKSYSTNQLVIQVKKERWLVVPGGTPGQSDSPSELIPSATQLHFISGHNASGRLCTMAENAETLAGLIETANFGEWDWHHAAVLSPERDWVESGILVQGLSDEDAIGRAAQHAQEAVIRWTADGLTALASGTTPALRRTLRRGAVPVRMERFEGGCPMRWGDAEKCTKVGGPYGSAAIHAAFIWQYHQQYLKNALGCGVCDREWQGGPGRAIAFSQLYVPSRRGGWQCGPPTAGRFSVSDTGLLEKSSRVTSTIERLCRWLMFRSRPLQPRSQQIYR